MNQRQLLAVGAVVGGLIAVRRLLASKQRTPMIQRMMERLPADSPPRLIMSILPRLREQNDEIIAMLGAQNELLRQRWPGATPGSEIPS